MAKGKKERNRGDLAFEEFVKRPPELTVLTDHPLTGEEIEDSFADDPFNFRYKLGPVFDILRHPGTKTPAAILISGGWGTGKTSAMKWLECLLEKWNKTTPSGGTKVRPVWFYPWKYDNKEDVRKGLIAEVIINAVYVMNPENKKITISSKKLLTGLKLLGSFGLKVVTDLVAASEYEIPVIPGLKISGEALKKIKDHYSQAAHPEAAFLNELEEAMKYWVEESLGKNGRMVIFIDDLDRCMPDIALQVLEALKLYLNIANLVFVAGVDKEIIQNLVVEHHRQLGLVKEKGQGQEETEEEQRERMQAERKARQYLSKMFQVEIDLAPSQKQVADFFEQQIKDLTIWDEQLGKRDDREQNYRDLFQRLILKFARRNPRELKRQLNNALMAGVGTGMIDSESNEERPTFEQGLQLYFIREILTEGYTLIVDMINTDSGRRFFKDWSDLAIAYKDVPEKDKYPGPEAHQEADVEKSEQGSNFSKMLAGQDTTYETGKYLQLLNNLDLRSLMEIPFSTKLAEFTSLTPLVVTPRPAEAVAITEGVNVVVTPKRPVLKDYIIVRDAVARQLNKNPDEVELEAYRDITELDLSKSGISDLRPLKGFTNLRLLDLHGVPVNDISVVAHLKELRSLNLYDTKVSDISAVEELTHLEGLGLNGTPVSDITVVARLENLQGLYLDRTNVKDISVVRSLTKLRRLGLDQTEISDISVVRGLTSLRYLGFNFTQVSDIGALSALTNLQELYLGGAPVIDIRPLASLTNLKKLHLFSTQVSDIRPLAGLANLQEL